MPSCPSHVLRRLAAQFAMGGALGASLALALLVIPNRLRDADWVWDTSSALPVPAIFVAVVSLYFAVGATLTGFLLIKLEQTGQVPPRHGRDP